jgi:TRAP-type C4-dicarboxylate transport system permease small subunit
MGITLGGRMGSKLERIALWMHHVGAVLTLAVTAVICFDVGGRLLFNHPFSGGPELAATGLVMMVFLQVPHSILQRKLLRVTFLYDRAGTIGRSVLNGLAYVTGMVFFAFLCATSWEPLLESFRTAEFYGMDAFRIPAWPLRLMTFLLWLLASLTCLFLVRESLAGRMTAAENQIPD